jgi:hypothetical protein
VIDWVADELTRLRGFWPDLEYFPDGHWILKRAYVLPPGWTQAQVDLAIRIPAGLPAEAPYGFWVRNGLTLASGGAIGNYAFPSDALPMSSDPWGKFSWSPALWTPKKQPGLGTGMVHFAESVWRRLEEAS